MQSRLAEDKSATGKKKGTAKHYKRVHEDSQLENANSNQQNAFYCAAAEDDQLGWSLGDATFDPMYTVNRRNCESDSKSKESFFKKLKVRLENNKQAVVNEKVVQEKPDEPKRPPSSGIVKFGFGMMGDAGIDASNKKKGDKKDKNTKEKRDKKSKDKDKKSRKQKSKE
ncbi:hypothetical protein IW147_004258 [Coemansia sp. RSA 720]|nr:hypothetical protein LPJ76_000506 [Coemansia sp. RSA 638]KAJ2121444.1 hypothetical protein IW147_004258 [Coemansia sp. RSA 720]